MTLQFGGVYTVSFDYRARPDATGAGTVTFTDEVTPQTLPFVGTQDWQNFTFTTTAVTGTSGSLSFLGVNPVDSTDNRPILDNVSVVAVPEPTTGLLLAGGLFGMMARRRRA